MNRFQIASLSGFIGFLMGMLLFRVAEEKPLIKPPETKVSTESAIQSAIQERDGAIQLANQKRKGFELQQQLAEEGTTDFGILASSPEKVAQLTQRAKVNPSLAAALKEAKKNDVSTVVAYEFRVGNSMVWINLLATDQEIIDFLLGEKVSTIDQSAAALTKHREQWRQEDYDLERDLGKLGVAYYRWNDREEELRLLQLIKSNKQLRALLTEATSKGTFIEPWGHEFKINDVGYIQIPEKGATAQQIIDFLLDP